MKNKAKSEPNARSESPRIGINPEQFKVTLAIRDPEHERQAFLEEIEREFGQELTFKLAKFMAIHNSASLLELIAWWNEQLLKDSPLDMCVCTRPTASRIRPDDVRVIPKTSEIDTKASPTSPTTNFE